MTELSQSAQRVQQTLDSLGLPARVVELPSSTRTALEAAAAVGCQVGQIVKSLIFMGATSHKPVLVVASGSNRVNEQALAGILGEPIKKADADFVRTHTGYAIGGVPPVGLTTEVITFIDQDLLAFDRVWAAAGTPHAVFELDPQQLAKITGGQIVSVL
jgi:prolyl-tRNA editing enzyme YbaK/EbsC (Cys-tRNA(Pro) deacylase)